MSTKLSVTFIILRGADKDFHRHKSSRLCHLICMKISILNISLYLLKISRSRRGVANFTGYIGHCWMMKTRRNTITFLVFFQEKCRAIKFNLVVETLFSFCLFDFFCSRQTNNLNMKQQPQKQQSWDIFWLNLEKSKDFD